jgi:hypothetical protein
MKNVRMDMNGAVSADVINCNPRDSHADFWTFLCARFIYAGLQLRYREWLIDPV